ncbi:MFS transporter [Streptomyces antnestii]|uniref:MFS transporter n=1 Tax=Streptomyces antnestii TaxID=2494256 RepID=A0A437PLF0_9ACTN|nr:MFS transporter [Streptomyces sp. San01]RVU23087.1 MFS transporter [Streptomyces sp. San01]
MSPRPSAVPTAPASPAVALSPRRWTRLMPIVFVTYSFAYLERSNFSVATAGGMADDLHITGSVSALLGSLFFLGYFLFQIPGALYAQRRSVKRLIVRCLAVWGVLATAQGLIPNVHALMAVRFVLGMSEAAVLPAMVIYITHWFTARERGRANTWLILGNPATVLWLTVLSGYLVEWVGWRGMFIAQGVPAVAWAFVFHRFVDDKPADAAWLTETERADLDGALEAEQRGLRPVTGYGTALRSANVLLLSAQYLLWSLGVYGFVFWLPSIVAKGSDEGIGTTGLISAAPYLFACIAMLLNSRASDRAGRRARFVWPWLLTGALAFYGSYLLGDDFWLSFPLLCVAGAAMYAPYGPFFASIPEFLPSNVSGAAIALINSFGALGGFAGSYLIGMLNDVTGSTAASFLTMAACLAGAAALTLAVRPAPVRAETEAEADTLPEPGKA